MLTLQLEYRMLHNHLLDRANSYLWRRKRVSQRCSRTAEHVIYYSKLANSAPAAAKTRKLCRATTRRKQHKRVHWRALLLCGHDGHCVTTAADPFHHHTPEGSFFFAALMWEKKAEIFLSFIQWHGITIVYFFYRRNDNYFKRGKKRYMVHHCFVFNFFFRCFPFATVPQKKKKTRFLIK